MRRSEMLVQVLVNDPMGQRCRENMAAVMSLKERYVFDIAIVKKTGDDPDDIFLPSFPAILVDGTVVCEGAAVDKDELERTLGDV